MVDERGEPVGGAIVQFMEESDRFVEICERAVRTDEHGDFVLERSAVLAYPESAFLHVHASGFAPWQCVLAELQSELRATTGMVERTVVLRRGATVHGVIVDRSGQACEGLEVSMGPNESVVRWLPPGTYLAQTAGAREGEMTQRFVVVGDPVQVRWPTRRR